MRQLAVDGNLMPVRIQMPVELRYSPDPAVVLKLLDITSLKRPILRCEAPAELDGVGFGDLSVAAHWLTGGQMHTPAWNHTPKQCDEDLFLIHNGVRWMPLTEGIHRNAIEFYRTPEGISESHTIHHPSGSIPIKLKHMPYSCWSATLIPRTIVPCMPRAIIHETEPPLTTPDEQFVASILYWACAQRDAYACSLARQQPVMSTQHPSTPFEFWVKTTQQGQQQSDVPGMTTLWENLSFDEKMRNQIHFDIYAMKSNVMPLTQLVHVMQRICNSAELLEEFESDSDDDQEKALRQEIFSSLPTKHPFHLGAPLWEIVGLDSIRARMQNVQTISEIQSVLHWAQAAIHTAALTGEWGGEAINPH